MLARLLFPKIQEALGRGRSVLLLGARQTGKSTLCKALSPDLSISLLHPTVRQRYEQEAAILIDEIKALAKDLKKIPLIFLDEVQKVPALMDAVQYLIDEQIAQFLITGSSARKLRKQKANWLPGRVILYHLDPLMIEEMETERPSLETLLQFGALPRIILTKQEEHRVEELNSYVQTYIEDEIRAEAAVRNVSDFVRFLPLAAAQSGKIVNFSKLSQDVGVAHTTITNYYQILEDCLIAHRIEPLVESNVRTRLTRSPKYLFFDLGVRRFCAKETATNLPQEYLGQLFEEFVGLELIKHLHLRNSGELLFWRDNNGPEIDWVIHLNEQYIPVEVKWTDKPSFREAKHLQSFIKEYTNAKIGYIVCRTPNKMQLAENIIALPWQNIGNIITT